MLAWRLSIFTHIYVVRLPIAITFNTCKIFCTSIARMNSQTTESSVKTDILKPPASVFGMKVLDRDAFNKEIEVPSLVVPVGKMKEAFKVLKPCLLKMPCLPPIQGEGSERRFLFHPGLFDEKLPYLEDMLKKLCLGDVSWTKIQLAYNNFTHDSIFKAILPPDTAGNVSSFSIVGHIIHLNLKENLMDYKYLIGQVLLDKYSNIKTVINKVQVIETEFRNFHMELLAGEPEFEVVVKENGFRYTFDFSKVFWNPRLIHEHEEIVKKANAGDVVYDVFAGVGPFAVPMAKKKCKVHANDLNPDSYRWLCKNAELNKVNDHLKTYNLDGREFIKTAVKDGLTKHFSDSQNHLIHIIMNLPACALEFLDAFEGLLDGYEIKSAVKLPVVYCYFFLKKDEDALDVVEKYFNSETIKSLNVTPVRIVAPNKRMMRITYTLPKSVLFYKNEKCHSEPPVKKIKSSV